MTRLYSQQPPKKYDFVKASDSKGPIRWASLAVTFLIGGAAVYYVKQAKDEMEISMFWFNEIIITQIVV